MIALVQGVRKNRGPNQKFRSLPGRAVPIARDRDEGVRRIGRPRRAVPVFKRWTKILRSIRRNRRRAVLNRRSPARKAQLDLLTLNVFWRSRVVRSGRTLRAGLQVLWDHRGCSLVASCLSLIKLGAAYGRWEGGRQGKEGSRYDRRRCRLGERLHGGDGEPEGLRWNSVHKPHAGRRMTPRQVVLRHHWSSS